MSLNCGSSGVFARYTVFGTQDCFASRTKKERKRMSWTGHRSKARVPGQACVPVRRANRNNEN